MRRWLGSALALAGLLGAAGRADAACPGFNLEGRRRVEVVTSLGRLCLDLLDRPGEAPLTVENFLRYARRGDYDGSFFHRLIPGFVLQGGGYRHDPVDGYQTIAVDPPVANEPGISNVRGTVAMAKQNGQPNSATNQWFVNLGDNTDLDAQNGGFTVFARVEGFDLGVLDALAALHTEYGPFAIRDDPMQPFAAALTNLPVLELLPRDPDGYGCVKVFPDPLPNGQPTGDTSACATQADVLAGIELTIRALDPEVPERLVRVETVDVLEPGAPCLLANGIAVLGLVRLGGRRRPLPRGMHPAPAVPVRGVDFA